MTAVDDLTELVERAAAAEKVVLALKWREQSDVRVPLDRARKSAAEQRHEMSLDRSRSVVSTLGGPAEDMPRPRTAARAARTGSYIA